MAKYVFRTGRITIYFLLPLFTIGLVIWAFCHKSYATLDQEITSAKGLESLAQEYYQNGQYIEAEQVCLELTSHPVVDFGSLTLEVLDPNESLSENYPVLTETNSEIATASIENIVQLYVDTEQKLSNFEILVNYLAAIPSDYNAAKLIGQAAQKYQQQNLFNHAKTLNQCISKNWPGTDLAMASLANLALAETSLGNDPNAVIVEDLLLIDYEDNMRIQKTLYDLADTYCNHGYYRAAYDVYQKVKNKWADEERSVVADFAMSAISGIENKIDPNQPSAISELATSNWNSSYLNAGLQRAWTICYAEGIRNDQKPENCEQNLYQTIQICEIALATNTDEELSAEACYRIAESYRRLEQEDKAISYYHRILTDWPDYKFAWNAQFMIARCSEKLSLKGVLDSHTAQSYCMQAYRSVCQDFPTCPAAKAAFKWLKSHDVQD